MHKLNPHHWTRLLDLMLPPVGASDQAAGGALASLMARTGPPQQASSTALSPEMPAIVLHRQGQVVRILRLGGGTLPVESLAGRPTQQSLRAFRHEHQLPFVAAVDLDLLPRLWSATQASVKLEDDFIAQQLAMLRVFRDALGKGVLVDPKLLGAVPIPQASLLQMTFDRMLPDGRSFVFYLLDGGAIYTSLIVAKRAGDIELVTTHDAIADRVPHLSSVRDARLVLEAVKERIARPHIGIFLPLGVWHETVDGDRSAIARAMATRRAVLDPAPAWLLAIVGAGIVAEAATRTGRLAGQLLSASRLGAQLFGSKRAERLVQTLSNPLEALGLDPWETLRWGRDWRRRIQLDRARLAPKSRRM